MKKNTLLSFVAFLAINILVAQVPSITVTAHPTEIDENAVAVSGTVMNYSVEVRNWPTASSIFFRIKTGTDPDGTNDYKNGSPDPFRITSATTTNADGNANYTNVSAVTLGEMVTFDGQTKQGYNVDLTWTPSAWTAAAASPASGDDLIFGGAGFFNNAFAGDKVVVLGAAPMTFTPSSTILDAVAYNFGGVPTIQDNTTLLPITYTSADPIAVGGIKVTVQSDTQPFSTVTVGTYGNDVILAAGTDMTANIPISNVPAIYTVENVDGGILLANVIDADSAVNQLLERNPNGQAGATNAFYRLIGVVGDDPNFTATLPQDFRGIKVNPVLSTNDFNFDFVNVSLHPNPTKGIINITGLNNIEKITIHNMLGQLVKIVENTNTLNISDLETGMYFLETNNGLKRKVLKN